MVGILLKKESPAVLSLLELSDGHCVVWQNRPRGLLAGTIQETVSSPLVAY